MITGLFFCPSFFFLLPYKNKRNRYWHGVIRGLIATQISTGASTMQSRIHYWVISSFLFGGMFSCTGFAHLLLTTGPMAYAAPVIAYGGSITLSALLAVIAVLLTKASKVLLIPLMFIAGMAPAYIAVILGISGILDTHQLMVSCAGLYLCFAILLGVPATYRNRASSENTIKTAGSGTQAGAV